MGIKHKGITDRTNRNIGASLSMLNMVISLLISLIYSPFVLRTLGQSEYGIFSLAMSIIGYLSVLDMGFGNAHVRYSTSARAEGEDDRNINGMFLLFYFIISLIALIVGLFIGFNLDTFFSTGLTPDELIILKRVFYVLLVNIVVAFPMSLFSSIIRSHEKFAFSGILSLVSNILRHAAICLFLALGYRSLSMALVSLAATLITAFINIYFCFFKLKVKIGFKKYNKAFYKDVFSYSFFVLLNILVNQLYASTDNIILGKVCGSIAVAVYGIGVFFQTYFSQLSTSISGVYFSHISKLSVKEDGISKMSEIFVNVGRLQLLLLSYILIGFIAYGREFISLWAGDGYEDSYIIAIIIMLPSIIPLTQNIGISILQALNKHKVRSVMYIVIALFNIGLSIPLSILLEGIGAAIATSVGCFLGQILFMNWYYYKKIGLNIPRYWQQFFTVMLKELPMLAVFFATTFIPLGGWIGFIIKLAASQVIVLPYFYCIILNKDEKQLVKRIFSKARKRLHI